MKIKNAAARNNYGNYRAICSNKSNIKIVNILLYLIIQHFTLNLKKNSFQSKFWLLYDYIGIKQRKLLCYKGYWKNRITKCHKGVIAHHALVDNAIWNPADSTEIKYVGQSTTEHPTHNLQSKQRPQKVVLRKENEYVPEKWFYNKALLW